MVIGERVELELETRDVATDDPMPSLPPGIIIGVVAPTAALAVALGWLEADDEQIVVVAAGAWIGLVAAAADVYLRGKRNARRAQEAIARAMTRTGPPAMPASAPEPEA